MIEQIIDGIWEDVIYGDIYKKSEYHQTDIIEEATKRRWRLIIRKAIAESQKGFGSMSKFEEDITSLINKHSAENSSNTPDFILARYLTGCLAVFATTVQRRDNWYGDARKSSQAMLEETAAGRRS